MVLSFYDTLSRSKLPFVPLDVENVRLYVCGPTVYDFAHIGNARPVVVFDVLYRLLSYFYPKVTYVRNITDVDDKINERAFRTGQSIQEITHETAQVFQENMREIGALPPDFEPKATEHIAPMIKMISSLIEKGHAYARDGHVLFSVPSMPEYGQLSKRNRDEQIVGARVDVAPYKIDPTDFVLWKPSDQNTPGWQSPWGFGRPGWHIECSAMSHVYLGEMFDIHAGGIDLVFPHHENEIAQTRCAFDTPKMASIWMHNGYVTVEGEKMSKSLGNFYTVDDLLKDWPGEVIRYALLAGHYRSPLDYSIKGLADASSALDRLYQSLRATETSGDCSVKPSEEVIKALSDDLNTPLALSKIHQLAGILNKSKDGTKREKIRAELIESGKLLGLLEEEPGRWFQKSKGVKGNLTDAQIDDLILVREEARGLRDFSRADKIRDELRAFGVDLEDGPGGTSWKRI